jgi:hypothetical protein
MANSWPNAFGLVVVCGLLPSPLSAQSGWPQWAQNSRHTGAVQIAGQSANQILASIVIDPFVPLKVDDSSTGDLLTHYPSPLIDGNDVFLMLEGGNYISCLTNVFPCGSSAWNTLT